MTLQQVFKEIEVISNLVCDTTKVSLNYNEIGTDEELKAHCREKNITLHEPSTESPYFFFMAYHNNVDAIIRGKSKKVTINY
jgi:hypothetical protein